MNKKTYETLKKKCHYKLREFVNAFEIESVP